jgi:hypothetical protein
MHALNVCYSSTIKEYKSHRILNMFCVVMYDTYSAVHLFFYFSVANQTYFAAAYGTSNFKSSVGTYAAFQHIKRGREYLKLPGNVLRLKAGIM